MKRVFFLVTIFILPIYLLAQSDTALIKSDSLSTVKNIEKSVLPLASFLQKNQFLNCSIQSETLINQLKSQPKNQTIIFYILCIIALILALLKYFYAKYLRNLFQVFFNTSLRQSQISDQLKQSSLISLYFNLFFFIVAGVYIVFVLQYFHKIDNNQSFTTIPLSIIFISIIFFIKYQTLKFTGWITNNKDLTDVYVFVVFLINKVLGVFLFPFVIIITFATNAIIVKVAIYSSIILCLLVLGLRFLRTYGLLQHKIKTSWFHFGLYILGVEVIPLLILNKWFFILLNKNI